MRKKIKIYDNKIFAERLRTLMAKHNANLADIARKTGCAVSTASTWKRGRIPRKRETLEKIANFFRVDADYLSGNDLNIFSNELEKSTKLVDKLKLDFDSILKKANGRKSELLVIRNTLDNLCEKIRP